MYIGPYSKLKPWLTKHFGELHYTDDNHVVNPALETPSTVAEIVQVDAGGFYVRRWNGWNVNDKIEYLEH